MDNQPPAAALHRILVIEDYPAAAGRLAGVLTEAAGQGCAFESAENLEAGLTRLRAPGIAAVLLDLQAPDERGIEICARLRQQAPAVPVVVLSGVDDEKWAEAVMRAGAQDYLVKGELQGGALVRALNHAIGRQRADAGLRSSVARHRHLFDQVTDVILFLDGERRVVKVNPACAATWGYSPAELEGRPLDDLIAPADLEDTLDALGQARAGHALNGFENRIRRSDGVLRWMLWSASWAESEQLMYCVIRDIAERKAVEIERQKYLDTVSQVEEVVFALDDDDRLAQVSPAWTVLTGYLPAEKLNHPLSECVHLDDQAALAAALAALRNEKEEFVNLSFRLLRRNHKEIWVVARLLSPRNQAGGGGQIRGVLRDYTDTHLHEKRLTELALHDALTGLPNRVLLTDRLNVALAGARRTGGRLGVGIMDFDHFKMINDTLGHPAGDDVLLQLTARFKQQMRTGDTLARWGGDEFVLVLPDIHDAADVRAMGEKFREIARRPIAFAGRNIFTAISIGFAVFPDHALTAEELLSKADYALFHAKQQGRNRVQTFDDLRLAAPAGGQPDLHAKLHHAAATGGIQLHFQPMLAAASGAIAGAEGLARWHDETEGWISPAIFIPLAENLGLMKAIEEQLTLQLLRQLRAWRDGGLTLQVALNLSKRQLYSPAFVSQLQGALAAHGLTPVDLVLEVTETTVLLDLEQAASRLAALAAAGFRLSMDDFGTGQASLSLLHQLPLHELKIDVSLIRRLDTQDGRRFVQAIIDLGRDLGLRVVAEGIEAEAAGQRLRAMGIDRLQGNHYSPPLPAAEFETFLRALAAR